VSLAVEIILCLLLAVALGTGIGYQTERCNKPAGLHTHIIISVGAAIFTVFHFSVSAIV